MCGAHVVKSPLSGLRDQPRGQGAEMGDWVAPSHPSQLVMGTGARSGSFGVEPPCSCRIGANLSVWTLFCLSPLCSILLHSPLVPPVRAQHLRPTSGLYV